MKCTGTLLIALPTLVIAIMCFSCNKSQNGADPAAPYALSYGDSIIYLKSQSSDYIIFPTETRLGTYTGFPDGIEIDATTGAINVSKSETGLRYRITHTSPEGVETQTKIVLSGI